MTKERPILFSGPMVKAILENRKTQTRRVVKPQPTHRLIDGLAHVTRGMDPADDGAVWYDADGIGPGREVRAPWRVDDILWVRETWGYRPQFYDADAPCGGEGVYRADGDPEGCHGTRWRPSIHMPRWACRLTLRVESVRVERLQEISVADCHAEGIAPTWDGGPHEIESFERLWDSINGKRHPWASNPWVWVVTFARL